PMTDTKASAVIPRRRIEFSRLLDLTLVVVLLAMFALLWATTQSFLTPGNISNLARQGAMFAILAVGETFVVITAGIDLSVGAIVGFITVIMALLLQNDVPVFAAILISLLV
ncbi:ABC transporter permease, partial [Mycobacterium tuberculosis]|nr:ABC transporter permease [Mycobacterium tuberculosis]